MALKEDQVNTIANAIKELLGVGVEVLADNLTGKTKKDKEKENTETDEHEENSQDNTKSDQDD